MHRVYRTLAAGRAFNISHILVGVMRFVTAGDSYVVHHLLGTGLCCAPPTCVVNHQHALSVHNVALCRLGGAQDDFACSLWTTREMVSNAVLSVSVSQSWTVGCMFTKNVKKHNFQGFLNFSDQIKDPGFWYDIITHDIMTSKFNNVIWVHGSKGKTFERFCCCINSCLNIPILPMGILDFCKQKLSAPPMVPMYI